MTKQNNNFIIGIVIVLIIIILLGSFGFGSYGMMGGYNSGFMLFGWIFNILIIILIVLGILWLIKNMDYIRRRLK